MKDVTNEVHEETRKMAITIAQKLDMQICGVDIISSDISQPLSETNGIILELNATPGISGDYEIMGVNTAEKILKTAL